MRYISIFSGIEAASVAWMPLGWEPVCFSEIGDFPSAVLKARFPDVPNLGDITKVDWREFSGKADVVVGGSPCQSFSIAGGREGLNGESALMFEFIRCVLEVGPRWFLWENVPGALTSEHGEAFRQLLSELAQGGGYGLSWRVLDAQFFGVPQRRRRLFLVGRARNGYREACSVLFEPEGLRWNPLPSSDERKALVAASGRGSQAAVICRESTNSRAVELDGIGTTLNATHDRPIVAISDGAQRNHAVALVTRYGKPGGGKGLLLSDDVSHTLAQENEQRVFDGNGPHYVIRRLTPREYERLHGFPDDWTFIPYKGKPSNGCPDKPRYKALGNSMAVPVMRWIGRRIQMVDEMEGG